MVSMGDWHFAQTVNLMVCEKKLSCDVFFVCTLRNETVSLNLVFVEQMRRKNVLCVRVRACACVRVRVCVCVCVCVCSRNLNVPLTAQGHLIAKWVYICAYMGINIRFKKIKHKTSFWDPYLYLQSNFTLLRNFLNSAF